MEGPNVICRGCGHLFMVTHLSKKANFNILINKEHRGKAAPFLCLSIYSISWETSKWWIVDKKNHAQFAQTTRLNGLAEERHFRMRGTRGIAAVTLLRGALL